MKAAYVDNFVTAYCGDALEVMRGLPAGSVHCCVTSPPYWGLRDYGQDGQLGLDRTPEEYVGRMVEYFRAVNRLLRKDGTLWLNLGDSYATGAGAVGRCPGGGDQGERFLRQGHINTQPNRMPLPGLKAKDMVGIPWRVAFALQADGWYLRKEIIWNKPNPMPESVTDRCTSSHEQIFHFAKCSRYYHDAEAIKEPGKNPEKVPAGWDTGPGGHDGKEGHYRKTDKQRGHGRRHAGFNERWDGMSRAEQCGKGRNKRDVWTVATKPYDVEACLACRRVYDGTEYRRLRREKVDEISRVYCVCGAYDHWKSHYATFPPALILPCILAGCPKGGTVLDPFAGSGTTGEVARETGRKAILIELNFDDIDLLMKKRFGATPLPATTVPQTTELGLRL